MMQLCSAVQGEGTCEQVQVQVLGQVSTSISLQVDSASPSRAAPTLAPFRAAATGRLERGQACLPDLIWSFPGLDHFRPDRSSTAIQLHLTSQQSTGQPANQLVSPNQHPIRLMNRRWPAKFRRRGHEIKRSLSGQPTTEGKRTSPAPAPSHTHATSAMDALVWCQAAAVVVPISARLNDPSIVHHHFTIHHRILPPRGLVPH